MNKRGITCGIIAFGLITIGFIGCVDVVPPGGGGPDEFTNADGIVGGKYYDKFYASDSGFDQNHPNIDTFTAFGNFFRCKQCHAWDRMGNTASYINREPRTTRPNVSGILLATHVDEMTAQELFNSIKTSEGAPRRPVDTDLSTYDPADPATTTLGDQMPDYSQILTDTEIWNLVRYLKVEVLDTTQLYTAVTQGTYPTGSITYSDWGMDGDPVNGNALYATNCAGCHNDDGVDGVGAIDNGNVTVGFHLRNKPYETWHKVKFGQPDSTMGAQGITTLADMKDLYAALSDSTNFPD